MQFKNSQVMKTWLCKTWLYSCESQSVRYRQLYNLFFGWEFIISKIRCVDSWRD